MKALHILEALEAMKAAEQHLSTYPDDRNDYQRESWRLYDQLSQARIRLAVNSRITEVEIEVEK